MTTEVEQNIQRFTVGAGSELSVSNISGRVNVTAHEGAEIIVKYAKRGGGRLRETTNVEISQSGNRVSVQTRGVTVGIMNFGRSSAIDYEIQVPRDCKLSIRGVSSDVVCEGTRSGGAIQTVSGGVKLVGITGEIGVTTVSGNIRADDLNGTLVARTTSGNGSFHKSRFRRFSVNTVSGDFTVETPLSDDEHCQAKTVSGDLELLLPADTGATVQLKSVSGSVSCELPAEIIKSGRRHWQGRLNGGGSHLEMNSISGDLRIRRQGSDSGASVNKTWQANLGRDFGDPGSGTIDVEGIMESVHSVVGPIVDTVQSVVNPVMRSVFETNSPSYSADTSPSSESSTSSDSQSDETAAILAALERGELSVDEAMAKLEAIN